MMPWPHPLRALEAVAGEGESVNSYREENFSLLCELMGLPGVRLQLETVLELSSVDWTKVSRLLSVNQDPRVRLWAGRDSLCALCGTHCPPEKCCPVWSSYQRLPPLRSSLLVVGEEMGELKSSWHHKKTPLAFRSLMSGEHVLGTKPRSPSFPLLACGTWHLLINTLEPVSSQGYLTTFLLPFPH